MDTLEFSCDVDIQHSIDDNPINLEIKLNNNSVYKNNIIKNTHIQFPILDADNEEQSIEFIVSQKSDIHTTLDSNGEIICSTELIINNIKFDDISIDKIIAANPLPYIHNSNGNSKEVIDNFYNVAGCNGSIKLTFTTPFYLWLLENM